LIFTRIMDSMARPRSSAAVRNGKQFVDCARAGADIVTAGLQVYKDSMYHPFTDYGMAKFQGAWDKTVTE
jgi:transaldolase